jgi:hypothetical protein
MLWRVLNAGSIVKKIVGFLDDWRAIDIIHPTDLTSR